MRLLACVPALLFACGGPGQITGRVADQAIPVNDATFATDLEVQFGQTRFTIPFALYMGDAEGVCEGLQENRRARNTTSVQLSLIRHDGRASFLPVTPGEYTVIPAFPQDLTQLPLRAALASIDRADETCANSLTREASTAMGGKVVLRTLKPEAGGQAWGSFELLVGTQSDRVLGDFTATFCKLETQDTLPACE
jgi:hypothetical protein